MSTYAPSDLMAVLSLFNANGAGWASLGCVGDSAHTAGGGYHIGRNTLVANGMADDYSLAESPRDGVSRTDGASAVDFAGTSWWRPLTLWLVNACHAGSPGTECVREIIYTPDGQTVRRWDRLGIRTSGDDSHLWHTHVSFFRDSEGGPQRAAFLDLVLRFFTGQPATPSLFDAEDRMPAFETGAVAPGFYDAVDPDDPTKRATHRANATAVLCPPVNGGALPWGGGFLSFGCDFTDTPHGEKVTLRVAVHAPAGWAVRTITLDATTPRTGWNNGNAGLPDNADKISVGRVQASATDQSGDVPVAWLLEFGAR
jgi:hypothetical protein